MHKIGNPELESPLQLREASAFYPIGHETEAFLCLGNWVDEKLTVDDHRVVMQSGVDANGDRSSVVMSLVDLIPVVAPVRCANEVIATPINNLWLLQMRVADELIKLVRRYTVRPIHPIDPTVRLRAAAILTGGEQITEVWIITKPMRTFLTFAVLLKRRPVLKTFCL